MINFGGFSIVESPLMVDTVHTGSWLNGYKGSNHRSKRLKKKILFGGRKTRGKISSMVEDRPQDQIIRIGNTIYGHPQVVARLMKEFKVSA